MKYDWGMSDAKSNKILRCVRGSLRIDEQNEINCLTKKTLIIMDWISVYFIKNIKNPTKQIFIFLELQLAPKHNFRYWKIVFSTLLIRMNKRLMEVKGQINSLQSNPFLELLKAWPRGLQCRSSKIDNQLVPAWVNLS